MKKVLTKTEMLPERLTIKEQKMKLLARSYNIAIYEKVKRNDPVKFVVGLIYSITYSIPSEPRNCLEYFLSRESGDYQTIWIYDDYNLAFNYFKKLVKEHG